MAQTLQIKMSRNENSPWGFRLHGGVDFGTPLTIQKVNFRSLSESLGLQAGDVIVAINGFDISGCKHKEAQEKIVSAGNSFQLTIQRGAGMSQQQTWKPQVTPVGELPTKPTQPGQVFTKTSLAATKQEDSHWDVKHNQSPRGFAPAPSQPKQNGGPAVSAPRGQQYNNPSGLYSEESIKEVLNQQAETLASGVKGINFKQYEKPEKDLPANSEVLKALQEQEGPLKGIAGLAEFQEDRTAPNPSGFRGVAAPVTKPRPEGQPSGPPLSTCGQCGRLITGVFCKVQGKPLHAECFVCAACNCPLKNVGYFAVADKLYCEPHARAAKASQQIGQQMAAAPQQHKPQEQLYQQQQQQQQIKNVQQSSQSQQSKESWDHILNKDSAGMATNAEDFTKQFMSQMFGKETTSATPVGQPKFPSTSSPMMNRPSSGQQGYQPNQGSSMAQTQGILKVTNSDDIITTSNRPKKVGGSFQWPPQREDEDQGPTAVPMYINPNVGGGTTSPAPHAQHHFEEQQQRQQQQQQNHHSGGLKSQVNSIQQSQQYQEHEQQQRQYMEYQQMHKQQQKQNLENLQQQSDLQILKQQQQQQQYQPQQQLNQQQEQIKQQQLYQQQEQIKQQQLYQQQEQIRQQQLQQQQLLQQQQQQILQQQQHQSSMLLQKSLAQKQISAPQSILKQSAPPPPEPEPLPAVGPGQNVVAPRRGMGVLKQQQPGMRVPVCGACESQIRGPFITALGRTWCPGHFMCSQPSCGKSLQESGFVEEQGHLYCEDCYGKYLAPDCEKCRKKILGNCLKAMSKTFHPECFVCAYCGKIFANSPFYLEDGLPYCEEDWNELFTTKCVSCGFPIEAGDRWVEALNNNYHSQCFNCTLCKKNLEGKGFFVKAGKPFCKSHARLGV